MNEPTCFTNSRRQVAVQLADEYQHARADLDKFRAGLAYSNPAGALISGDEGFDAAVRCSVIETLRRELARAETPQDLARIAAGYLRREQAPSPDPDRPLLTDVRRRLAFVWSRYAHQLAAVTQTEWEKE